MERDGCVGCKYEHEDLDSQYCIGCKQNAIDKYKRMTNADKIRSMSDAELAKFLTSATDDAQRDALTHCDYQWLDWLQSESEK